MPDYSDRIRPNSYGIIRYLEDLRRGRYQIPTFQRDVVWDRQRVKRLWDTIYKFYPLGSILVWQTDVKLHDHRKIGGIPLRDDPRGHEHQYLLDGQQRTTALMTAIYGGDIKGQEDKNPELYLNLTTPEDLEPEDERWHERFLFRDEIDARTERKEYFTKGLIVKLRDIAHKYQDVEERLDDQGLRFSDPERKHLRRFRNVLDNYQISTIELRGIEVAEVCQIFERVNQAGQPLNIFDIVVAKTFRPDPEVPSEDAKSGFYLRGLFDEFIKTLQQEGSKYSTIDHLTLLQIVAVLVRECYPEAGVHNITDRFLNALRTEHIEGVWNDAKQAIRRAFDFLDNHLALPGPYLVPYRYFYMTLSAYFFRNRQPDYEMMKQYFWFYSFHNENLLTGTTQMLHHIDKLRLAKAGAQYEFERFLVDRETLRMATYSSRARLSRAMLALYRHERPVDWALPDRPVLVDVYYVNTDTPNLHHIFPRDFCEKELGEEGRRYADSLLNIAYLTQLTNLQISNQNPLTYLKQYIANGFMVQERTHLLPTVLREWAERDCLPPQALDQFIEARLELVLGRLTQHLGGIPINVIDTRVLTSA